VSNDTRYASRQNGSTNDEANTYDQQIQANTGMTLRSQQRQRGTEHCGADLRQCLWGTVVTGTLAALAAVSLVRTGFAAASALAGKRTTDGLYLLPMPLGPHSASASFFTPPTHTHPPTHNTQTTKRAPERTKVRLSDLPHFLQ
jgi:hypothetical protein